MKTFTLTLLSLLGGLAPAQAGLGACTTWCATKHDGQEARCRVKKGGDAVKDCLDAAQRRFKQCQQDCVAKNQDKGKEKPKAEPSPK